MMCCVAPDIESAEQGRRLGQSARAAPEHESRQAVKWNGCRPNAVPRTRGSAVPIPSNRVSTEGSRMTSTEVIGTIAKISLFAFAAALILAGVTTSADSGLL